MAAAVLGVVAAAMISSLGVLYREQERERRTLAAMELAHRLVLQHLDDPRALRGQQSLPIDYGGERYRWAIVKRPADLRARVGAPDASDTSRSALERLEEMEITVWLSEDSGGAAAPGPGVPAASLTRVYDPLPLSNPDSLRNMTESDESMRELIELLTR